MAFEQSPEKVSIEDIKKWYSSSKVGGKPLSTYLRARELYKEFLTKKSRGEFSFNDDTRVSLSLIAEEFNVLPKRIRRWFKHYCIEKGYNMSDYAIIVGPKHTHYLVPAEFIEYARRRKEEDDARWLPNPFAIEMEGG